MLVEHVSPYALRAANVHTGYMRRYSLPVWLGHHPYRSGNYYGNNYDRPNGSRRDHYSTRWVHGSARYDDDGWLLWPVQSVHDDVLLMH